MPPIMLVQKILELSENELINVLRNIEKEDRDLYNTLVEKIEDVL